MRLKMIEKLCCPFDKQELELTIVKQETEESVEEGYLLCSKCRRVYPIISGIPIMSPDEYREFELERPLLNRWLDNKVDTQFRLIEG
ncbi:Trm112 family protein [Riemerella anatipestifer]|nr:Trm112 family protein [Riemerella anatipestifer]MDY3354050.1 Trm112 family protein [Riemerella anatipestifer]